MKVDFYKEGEKIFRKCTTCGEYKELNNENFPLNGHGFMGFLGRCKICKRKISKTEGAREKARKRDIYRYNNNPQRRQYMYGLISDRRKRKGYDHIHLKTARHVKKLGCRPHTCPFCGTSHERIVAHHPDYSKRYEVVFCCPPCHSKIHNGDIEINESMIKNIL